MAPIISCQCLNKSTPLVTCMNSYYRASSVVMKRSRFQLPACKSSVTWKSFRNETICLCTVYWERDVASWWRVSSWCDGSLDRSFMVETLSYCFYQPVLHDWCNKGPWCDGSLDRSFMVETLSYWLYQPVLHDWCNKGPWYVLSCLWDGAYKRNLAANQKENPCGSSWFSLSLFEWSFTICLDTI